MVVNGNAVGLYVNNQLIGCLTNAEFTSDNEEIDATCKDNNGARSVLPGGNAWGISFEGNFNPASGYGLADLLGIHKNKTLVGVKLDDGTNLNIVGYAYLNSITWVGPLNAASTFSGAFTGDGAWAYSET